MEIAGVALPRDTVVFMRARQRRSVIPRAFFCGCRSLDIERGDQGRILTFGGGIHYCLRRAARAARNRDRALDAIHAHAGSADRQSRRPALAPRNSIRGVESLIAA